MMTEAEIIINQEKNVLQHHPERTRRLILLTAVPVARSENQISLFLDHGHTKSLKEVYPDSINIMRRQGKW
jgi:hypothetical protein